jgi:YD repeat-containing protein
MGNVTRVTRLDGTPNAVTTTSTFNGPFTQMDSVTDPLSHSTTFGYDPLGRLTTVTDALGHPKNFNLNGSGQLTSVSDALNNTVQYDYLGGDLVSVTDPLGNVSTSLTGGTRSLFDRCCGQYEQVSVQQPESPYRGDRCPG